MSFASAFNYYCDQLDCTSKQIADSSGISPSTISRYRSGAREPDADSEALDKLACAITGLAREKNPPLRLEAGEVRARFEAELTGSDMVGMSYSMRLDALMDATGVHNADIAEVTSVDPSYVSRIRHGQRMPAHIDYFSICAAHFIADAAIAKGKLAAIGALLEIPTLVDEYADRGLAAQPIVAEAIEVWLKGSQIVQSDLTLLYDLFDWLDTADFEEWISLGGSAECNPRSCPSSLARFYYGVGGMQKAEITFLNMAADTCAQNLSLSSDMPLMQIEPGSQFLKQYQSALVELVRRGCHVDVVYNIERPLADIIRSLRLWIPLYMTGLVIPHYLHGVNDRLFFHVNYVCDACALSSEAVMGHQESGRYFFSTRPEDVSYYSQKMGFILEKTSMLLETYRECDPGQKDAFERLIDDLGSKGRSRRIGASRYTNVQVTAYQGECTVLSVPCGETPVHFVLRHPKINYVIAHME